MNIEERFSLRDSPEETDKVDKREPPIIVPLTTILNHTEN